MPLILRDNRNYCKGIRCVKYFKLQKSNLKMKNQDKSCSSRVVVLGSASVDFTVYAPRLPKPGETLHGTKFATSYGGKGANQCVAAAKLGAKCFMIGRFGDDQWGKQYKDYLENLGIDVSNVHITPNVTNGIAQISVAENGENQIVIVQGANAHLSINDVNKSKNLIMNAEVLIGQLETPFETTLEAFKLNKGIRLLNAAPARADIVDILPHCSILCVNESEASLMTNMDVMLSNAPKAIHKLLQMGCEMVIITLGKDGAVFSSKMAPEVIHVECDEVTPVDTTGAGDAFVGALATYLLSHKNKPMHQIVGAACKIATISVTELGTQTSYPSNCDPFKQDYKYKKL